MAEARPDMFLRYTQPQLQDVSRVAVATELLGVDPDTVVFVPNATMGVNTVLRNLFASAPASREEILHFDSLYGACAKTIAYISESSAGRVSSRCVDLDDYPLDDAEVISRLGAAIAASRAAGTTPRVCVFDVVSSQPAVRFPFEAAAALCRAEGVLSLIDGAQGVGMVPLLHLGDADPDFLVSNCHKWLHVPRGCAVLYVPVRNQHLIRSTLPTSHGFITHEETDAAAGRTFSNSLPSAADKSPFVANFQFVGTLDSSAYLCVADAIRWRRDVLGGEDAIMHYTTSLARDGGRHVAHILGTHVMDNAAATLSQCAMTNVALPLFVAGSSADVDRTGPAREAGAVVDAVHVPAVTQWIHKVLADDHDTFIVVYTYRGRWWARLSAQVYLDLDDFDFAGRVLQELYGRVAKKEYLGGQSKL